MKYKILSHTADLRLEVYGKTLEELFINAAEALSDILVPEGSLRQKKLGTSDVRPAKAGSPAAKKKIFGTSEVQQPERIELRSSNINTLLVDFLNEILARSNINKKVYKVKDISVIASEELSSREAKPRGDLTNNQGKTAAPRQGGARSDKGAVLEAEIIGMPVKEFDEDVKAVTYHGVEIIKEGDTWKTKLVLDI